MCNVSQPQRDALELSYAKNLHRRELTYNQRAMVAAGYKEQLEGIARKLMEEGRSKGGQVAGRGRPKPPDSSPASAPESYRKGKGDSRTKAGKLLRVGEKAVDAASKIRKQGDPELVALVDNDPDINLADAAKVARLPLDEQRDIVRRGAEAVKHEARGQQSQRNPPDRIVSPVAPASHSAPLAKSDAEQLLAAAWSAFVASNVSLQYLSLPAPARNAFITKSKEYQ